MAVVTIVVAVVVVVVEHRKASETPLEPHEEGRRRVERRQRIAFEHSKPTQSAQGDAVGVRLGPHLVAQHGARVGGVDQLAKAALDGEQHRRAELPVAQAERKRDGVHNDPDGAQHRRLRRAVVEAPRAQLLRGTGGAHVVGRLVAAAERRPDHAGTAAFVAVAAPAELAAPERAVLSRGRPRRAVAVGAA